MGTPQVSGVVMGELMQSLRSATVLLLANSVSGAADAFYKNPRLPQHHIMHLPPVA